MSQVVQSKHTLPPIVQSLYDPIQEDLARAEQILQDELRSDSPFVDELLRYGGQLGGKRLRPALLLLTAQATGTVSEEHYVLAAVIEMIHTATLVHDDVLDEAEMRRHLATVNSRWSNESSVLLGDYLFSHAFYLASTLGTTAACQRIGRSTNLVCEGELRQVGNRGNHGLAEAEYYAIINGKTAELCACACQLGAHYAGATPTIERHLESYGRALGMAFQITDDLLDLTGDEQSTGKSLGTDLEKQKPTLPLIRVYELATPQERDEWVTILESRDVEQRATIAKWLDRFDALNYAREQSRRFAAEACEHLSTLPPSAAKTVLRELTEFIVARNL